MKTYTSPLDTLDLMAVAKAHPVLRRVHAGTYPLDTLPKLAVAGRPRHIIFNTSKSTEPPGTHWISIWLASDTTAEVMDSLGQRPRAPEVLNFLRRHASEIRYSTRRIQHLQSNTCGLYCLSHGLARAKGRTFASWIGQFSHCTQLNDRLMQCEFMRELALPSLFHPRLRSWKRAVSQACDFRLSTARNATEKGCPTS